MQHETIYTFTYGPDQVDLVGYYDNDTPIDCYEWFDFFNQQGECLNEGNAFFTKDDLPPSRDESIQFLTDQDND